MKQIKNAYLTGIEQIDKYLIEKPRLLGDEIYEFQNQQYTFHDYLESLLTLDQYKVVLETYYPEGYKVIVEQFAQDSGAISISSFIAYCNRSKGVNYKYLLLKNFTLTCIMANTYTEEIVNHLLWGYHTKPITANFVEVLVKFTKDKNLLKPLTNHSWYQVRQILAENGLFLHQLKSDRSKAVRTIVEKQLSNQ